ncbi:MAG: hypothetical protein OEY09_03220 [Gammaproteobacteria bacterium]|nr:hypothetical protein [Gammaproteobacteria bacterium]
MAKNEFDTQAQQIIGSFSKSQVVYANSLILTIFGDYICSHGGTIWLGSLIKLVASMGVNQRLVRTSVFRLTEKGILQSQQKGRRSFYSLTEKGFRQFSIAAERIYRYHDSQWDGDWRLVITTLQNIDRDVKERFNKELTWFGFNRLSNGVFAHPTASLEQVQRVITEMALEDEVVIMQAKSMGDNPHRSSANMIKYCFNSDAMKPEYEEFIDFFKDIIPAAAETKNKNEELCFLLRTLLIHKYRRILLRESELPHELVPADCLSHHARGITEQLYKYICTPAEHFFMRIGESENGALPPVDDEYFTRFGGLPIYKADRAGTKKLPESV